MIYFDNWELRADGILARQHEHLSRRLEIRGELPAGWRWDVLLRVGDAMDIVSLEPMADGVGVNLTRNQLPVGDRFYTLQLRGTKGEQVRYTNVVQICVPASLSGDDRWPTVPSEFTQMEQRMQEISCHPPVPGKGGFWKIWNPDSHSYGDSEFRLPNGGNAVELDATLTAEDKAAQAKAVGEALDKNRTRTMDSVNPLYVNQFLGVLKTYYDNRQDASGNNIFAYGHNTAVDGYTGNQIDCSAYVALGLMGIPFGQSKYASLNHSQVEGNDQGNDQNDGAIAEDGGEGMTNVLDPGDYRWAVDLKKYFRDKDGEMSPIRTAAQLCEWLEGMGLGTEYGADFSNVRRGDIVFYAKLATPKRLARRLAALKGYEVPQDITLNELREMVNTLYGVSFTAETPLEEFQALAEANGISRWRQPDRYKRVSHVAVVSSTFTNDNPDWGIDAKYPMKHTMFEVSDWGGVVLNTTLEKRYPDYAVAICRPPFGAVDSYTVSGGAANQQGSADVNKMFHEGFCFLTSAITSGLPSGVTNGLGLSLKVEKTYNKWGKPYSIVQTLYNTRNGDMWSRMQYCYPSYTESFSGWTVWKQSVGVDDARINELIDAKLGDVENALSALADRAEEVSI